jgi:protein-disulfide isomerase
MKLQDVAGTWTAIGAITCVLCLSGDANAASCKTPSSEKIAQVQSYVGELDNPGIANDFTLVESAQVNESCVWRLRFESSSTKSQTVYLSPDQQYLYREMYDLRSDPAADQRSREQELMKALTVGNPPSRGPSTAGITIVEFADFQCRYCRGLAGALAKQIDSDSKGNIKLVFRNFPLSMHPWAASAAQMGECAALQKETAFWRLHDFFFSSQQALNQSDVQEKAIAFATANTDLDIAQFKACIEKHLSEGLIKNDVDLGRRNYVQATPTLFVNGVRYEGYRDDAQLKAIVDAARRGDVWPVIAAHSRPDLP